MQQKGYLKFWREKIIYPQHRTTTTFKTLVRLSLQLSQKDAVGWHMTEEEGIPTVDVLGVPS